MSADNGIYIHEFRKGWKVCHAQAIENIFWEKGDKKYNYSILGDYFKGSDYYKTKEDALNRACELADEIDADDFGILEYGISFV